MISSLVMVCYNPLPECSRSVRALLGNASSDTQIILVDNHSYDPATRKFILTLADPRLLVVDPGRNIGCHNGFNFGFSHAQGDVLFKVDDDTCVLTKNFDKVIAGFLRAEKTFGFCAPLIVDLPVLNDPGPVHTWHGSRFQEVRNSNFSIVAWTRKTFHLLGELRPPRASRPPQSSLYGDEDGYYNGQANLRHLKKVVCLDIKASHQGTDGRLLYSLWKWWYGYKKATPFSFDDFLKNKPEQAKAAAEAAHSPDPTFQTLARLFAEGKVR